MIRCTKWVVAFAMAAICVGCTPGEAEFTFRTSAIRKALAGEATRIRVHEKMAIPLSNAYERVAFGGGRFTNQLDVVKALIAKQDELFPLDEFFVKKKECLGELTNDNIRLTVDESSGKVPVLRVEADLAIWFSQTSVLDQALRAGQVRELSALTIDPKTGKVDEGEFVCKDQSVRNLRFFSCMCVLQGQLELMNILFDDKRESCEKSENDLKSVHLALASVLSPTFFTDLSCSIVGDSDEPIGVEAEDVIVDGKHHDTFKATVKRGETLRLKINKNYGKIRFRKECQ